MDTMIRATSKAQYDAAQENWLKSYRELHEARARLAAAEQDHYAATEELCRHEVRPGLPRYIYGQAIIGDGGA